MSIKGSLAIKQNTINAERNYLKLPQLFSNPLLLRYTICNKSQAEFNFDPSMCVEYCKNNKLIFFYMNSQIRFEINRNVLFNCYLREERIVRLLQPVASVVSVYE